ncbi:MAG: sugar transferase [bacterium]|nr:sugar transferase [bacterium]
MKRINLIFTVLQVPIDAIMIFLALASSFLIRTSGQTEIYRWTFSGYLHLILISLPVWIIIFFTQGLYRIKQPLRGLTEYASLTIATLASWAMYIVGLYFYRSENTIVFPRLILLYSLILSFSFVLIGRWMMYSIRRLIYQIGTGVRVLLIGSNNSISQFIARELDSNKKYGYHIVKQIDQGALANFNIDKFNKSNKIDEIIVSAPNIPDEKLLPILEYCENNHIVYKMVPNLFEMHTSHAQNLTFLGIPVVELIYTPLQGWGKIVKRIMDIFISAIALIILSPIMLLVALLIKLSSEGPVFYRQRRVGQDSTHFDLLKFRSMRPDAEKQLEKVLQDPSLKEEFEKNFKLKNDPRITSIGRLIRRTNLDELPQFINVIKGEMSLVGPRPIVDAEMDKYGIYCNKRHIVKPGITGFWQVNGRNEVAYEERIRLDSYYIENWSIWLDISICVKTILSFVNKNAY